jgi:hypothetical protein
VRPRPAAPAALRSDPRLHPTDAGRARSAQPTLRSGRGALRPSAVEPCPGGSSARTFGPGSMRWPASPTSGGPAPGDPLGTRTAIDAGRLIRRPLAPSIATDGHGRSEAPHPFPGVPSCMHDPRALPTFGRRVPCLNPPRARPGEIRNISGFLRNRGRFFDDYLGKRHEGSRDAGDGRGSSDSTDRPGAGDRSCDDRPRGTGHATRSGSSIRSRDPIGSSRLPLIENGRRRAWKVYARHSRTTKRTRC